MGGLAEQVTIALGFLSATRIDIWPLFHHGDLSLTSCWCRARLHVHISVPTNPQNTTHNQPKLSPVSISTPLPLPVLSSFSSQKHAKAHKRQEVTSARKESEATTTTATATATTKDAHGRALLNTPTMVPSPAPSAVPTPASENGNICASDSDIENETPIKLVFSGSDLMSTSALKGMCQWGDLVFNSPYYSPTTKTTQTETYNDNGDYTGLYLTVTSCRPYTIGMALAWLTGVYECDELTDSDVVEGIAILVRRIQIF